MGMSMSIMGGFSALKNALSPHISMPAAPKPTPPPAMPKVPSATSVAKAQGGEGQSGGAPGVASTFLTGPQGVNPTQLLLGRTLLTGGLGGSNNTLLGS